MFAIGIDFQRNIWFRNWTTYNADGSIPDREMIDNFWDSYEPNEVIMIRVNRINNLAQAPLKSFWFPVVGS